MFLSKPTLASLVAVGLSLQVSAHAIIAPALGVKGTAVRANVQVPSTAKPCGNVDIASTINTSTAVTATGNTFSTTITNFNAGQDGSRQVTAQVDATGTGSKFVAATVTKNGNKAPTNVGSQQLTVELPAGTQCTGGANKDTCIVSFKTAGNFGNCIAVKQSGKTARAWGSRAARAASSAELEELD